MCSGIASETVAWHPLGWECVGFAEIDKPCTALLNHHYPDINNYGDFTTIVDQGYAHLGPVDLLVGGTPCQSFSIAGLRRGMDDARGQLSLEFCRLASLLRPRWVVWENVPGVFSKDGGRAFGSIIGALAELGYGLFWRVLDAQYIRVESHPFAVPQRRKRVFLVGHLGDWRPPAAVLLEPQSLSRHPAPRREAGKAVAGTLASRASAGGGLGSDFECAGGVIASEVAPTIPASGTTYSRTGNAVEDQGVIAYGTGNSEEKEVAGCLNAHQNRQDFESETFVLDKAPPLTKDAYADRASEEGLLIGFSQKDSGADAAEEVAPTMRAMPHDESHANAGGQVAIAAVQSRARGSQNGSGVNDSGAAYTHDTHPQAVAIQEQAQNENPEAGPDGKGWNDEGAAYTMEARQKPQRVAAAGYVRRITPTEAERLMGFPDDYTAIPFRGQVMKDGPRYRLLGNSIAVNVMGWLGQRIALFEKVTK